MTYFKMVNAKMQGFLTDISLLIVSLFEKHKQITQLFHICFTAHNLITAFYKSLIKFSGRNHEY